MFLSKGRPQVRSTIVALAVAALTVAGATAVIQTSTTAAVQNDGTCRTRCISLRNRARNSSRPASSARTVLIATDRPAGSRPR